MIPGTDDRRTAALAAVLAGPRGANADLKLKFRDRVSDMKVMRTLPSPWLVIKTDNVSWAILTSAPLVLFIALVIKFTGTVPGRRGGPDVPIDPGVASLILAGAVVLILFLAAIVTRRVARIRAIIDEGRQVEASVRKVSFFRGARTQLRLEFTLEGSTYHVKSTFVRGSGTPGFSENTRIPVLVDPMNPKRAIPLDLYALPKKRG